MAYDPGKDDVMHEIGVVDGPKPIHVRVVSYDGGDWKVSLTRSWMTGKGVERSGPLGRLTLQETLALIPLLDQAAEKIEA